MAKDSAPWFLQLANLWAPSSFNVSSYRAIWTHFKIQIFQKDILLGSGRVPAELVGWASKNLGEKLLAQIIPCRNQGFEWKAFDSNMRKHLLTSRIWMKRSSWTSLRSEGAKKHAPPKMIGRFPATYLIPGYVWRGVKVGIWKFVPAERILEGCNSTN